MTVKEKAYAKINLYLDVTGRREDGFHNIVSVMHSVSLCDDLIVSGELSDITEITIKCSDPTLPADESNLAYRSALTYLHIFNIKAKIDIDILKRIPVGAGLGGGSSDGAATLRAMNKIFRLADTAQLLKMAAMIGSDMPFCLIGGAAICKERGEKVSSFNSSKSLHVVISIGNDRVSTPRAYRLLDEKFNFFNNVFSNESDIRCKTLASQLVKGNSISGSVYNIFESVIKLDSIDKIKEIMTKSRAENALMSGSGPSVFGIFSSESEAKDAEKLLIESGFNAYYCNTVKG